MSTIERRRMDCPALPKGWKREEVYRRSGLSRGRSDVYYYSSTGRKFRSKAEMVRYLGDAVDLSNFDYSTGKNVGTGKKNNKAERRSQADHLPRVLMFKNETSITQPQRHIPPTLKQTVSVIPTPVPNSDDSSKPDKVKESGNAQDKPQQLFWFKRLEGTTPCDGNANSIPSLDLPPSFKSCGLISRPESLAMIHTVGDCIHKGTTLLTGQTGNKTQIEKNPSVYINPDQPFMQPNIISEEEVRRVEVKVKDMRNRLQEALDSYKCLPYPKRKAKRPVAIAQD